MKKFGFIDEMENWTQILNSYKSILIGLLNGIIIFLVTHTPDSIFFLQLHNIICFLEAYSFVHALPFYGNHSHPCLHPENTNWVPPMCQAHFCTLKMYSWKGGVPAMIDLYSIRASGITWKFLNFTIIGIWA